MTVVAKNLAVAEVATVLVFNFLVDVAVVLLRPPSFNDNDDEDDVASRCVLDRCCCLAVADDWLKMVVRILRLLLLPKPLVLS